MFHNFLCAISNQQYGIIDICPNFNIPQRITVYFLKFHCFFDILPIKEAIFGYIKNFELDIYFKSIEWNV
jgi:hypothetical protein